MDSNSHTELEGGVMGWSTLATLISCLQAAAKGTTMSCSPFSYTLKHNNL